MRSNKYFNKIKYIGTAATEILEDRSKGPRAECLNQSTEKTNRKNKTLGAESQKLMHTRIADCSIYIRSKLKEEVRTNNHKADHWF